MTQNKSPAWASGYVSRVLKVLNKYQNPYPKNSWEHRDWLEGYKTRKQEEYIKAYDGDRSGYYH